MGWTMHQKYEAPHKCSKPYYYDALNANIHKGDIIKCDCGKLWECIKENYTSDQREGSSWTTLEYKEHVVLTSTFHTVAGCGGAAFGSYPPGVR